jgi:2-polyprenyl-3-methyl-5-hydroxy-6-metoxy-1,4-benzoquinol methylase
MNKYGENVNSIESWEQMAESYSNAMANEYHRHRLRVINSLIPDDLYQEGKNIFDFGCGDAIHFEQFLMRGCLINGVDVSENMITIARKNLTQKKLIQTSLNWAECRSYLT